MLRRAFIEHPADEGEATATIDRKAWGIVWNQVLDQGGTMLGDDVAITIGVEAVRSEAAKGGGASAGKKS